MLLRILSICLMAAVVPAAGWSAITVTGVADKSYYLDTVTIGIQNDPGFTFTAAIDGTPVNPAGSYTESRFGYHELAVTRTPTGGGPGESLVVRFIVKDSARGGSSNTYAEAGLSRWTPLRSVDAPAEVLDAVPNVAIVTPSRLPPGFSLPVVVRLTDGTGPAIRVIGTMQIEGAGAPAGLRIYRGAGSRVIKSPASLGVHPLRFRLGTRLVTRDLTVDPSPAWQPLAGAADGMTFAPGSYVDVTGNVTVAAGQALTFDAGCIVRCGQGVEFDIQGSLAVNGTASDPVVFAAAANAVWGGVWVHGAGSQIEGHFLILTGGGADSNWIEDHSMHSHKSQQPLLTWSDGAGGAIEDCYIVDNPAGQSTHGEDSTFAVRRCLFQRSVSGGQIHNSNLAWEHNHLVEMPIDDTFIDAAAASDDNDCLYVDGGSTIIDDSVFGWCKDDGIDAGSGNSSNITVTNSWFESCVHEGMAWSEGGPRTVRDVVTMNNGQGLECGFTSQGAGTPAVNALRLYATGNLNGLRYGDNYDWSYSGSFDVHDSLSLFNADDVFGRHWGKFAGDSTTDWAYVGSDRSSIAYMHLEALPSQGWGATIVSVPQAEHPALPTWDPADPAHLAKLSPFLAFPNLKSGFGVAQETRLFPRASFGGQVTVRLDRPSGTTRVIPWKLIGKASLGAASESVLLTGDLTIAAGRQAADLGVPAVPGAGSFALLALVFQDSAECICTGNRTVAWLDLAFPPAPPAPTPTATVDGRLQLLWSDPDLVLQTNPNLDANWQDLPDARPPFAIVVETERMFYRLRRR